MSSTPIPNKSSKTLPFIIALPSILILTMLYVFLWFSSQGQDIIIGLSEDYLDFKSFIFFFFCISFVILSWTVASNSTLYAYHVKHSIHDRFYLIPSLIGTISILLLGYSVVNAAEIQNIYEYTNSGFRIKYLIIPVALVFFFLRNILDSLVTKLYDGKNRFKRHCFISILFIIGLLPILIETFTSSGLYYQSLLISPLSFAVLFFIISRKHFFIIQKSKSKEIGRVIPELKKFYNYSIIISLALVFYFNIFHFHTTYIGPINTLLLGLIVPSIISTFLIRVFIKQYNIYTFLLFSLFTIAAYFLLGSNLHIKNAIPLMNSEENYIRDNADNYIYNWINNLDCYHPRDSTIYLVASKGGGIRAAAWTNLILAKYMNKTNGTFYRNCVALSGSSGGMVGEGIFVALSNSKNPTKHIQKVKNIYKQEDFLSPIIIRLFGIEILNSLFSGLPISDRHEVLENTFCQSVSSHCDNNLLSEPYLNYLSSDSLNHPLLISSSYNTSKKELSVISPAKLNNFNGSNTSDFLSSIKRDYGKKTYPSLITGILQSARFPTVSPKGRTKNKDAFMDAGIFDNWGALATENILQSLKTNLKSDSNWVKKFKVKVILIDNIASDNNHPSQEIKETGIFSDGYSALMTQSNKERKKSLIKTISDLKSEIDIMAIGDLDYLPLPLSIDNSEKVVYPLGWYISNKSFQNMVSSLDSIQIKI